MDQPFEKRRKILEKIVTVIPNRVELSDCRLLKGEDDLREMMGEILMEDLEGIVMKGKSSVYNPDKRKWLKLKKDYLKGMADTADLVVLGAYYGTGKFGSKMSIFLMGCYDTEDKVWKTVCKVANGFDDKEIEELQTTLKVVKVEQGDPLPKWLDVKSSLSESLLLFLHSVPANTRNSSRLCGG